VLICTLFQCIPKQLNHANVFMRDEYFLCCIIILNALLQRIRFCVNGLCLEGHRFHFIASFFSTVIRQLKFQPLIMNGLGDIVLDS